MTDIRPDLRYHPVAGDIDLLLGDDTAKLLVVGTGLPSLIDFDITEARMRDGDADLLPTGVYQFTEEDGEALLVVEMGAPPGIPMQATWDAPDDDPLINAYGWLQSWWGTAAVVPTPEFERNQIVQTTPEGQDARIMNRQFVAGVWMYKVHVAGRSVHCQENSLAVPVFDDDPSEWVKKPAADVGRFAATMTRAKLDQELTDTVFSYRATRTVFRPYQFRPVLRLLDSEHLRLLIADEVGLGKTIEAGLVWTELDARRAANRVLVVCPSMLVAKWRAEMTERFGYELEELSHERLDDLLERVETDRLPQRFHVIVSVERMRVWTGLERLTELSPRFDLVIADEAHVFRNMGTRSYALGALLSDWADALVFLSATPLNLGNKDLYNLLELLAPGEFGGLFTLQSRLEPNAVLHRIAASLLDRAVDNAQRREWLTEINELTFGPAVTGRAEFHKLARLFDQPALDHAQVVEARRFIAQLHALSAVVTRTRKVEVETHKAVREARPINVEWTDEEAAFYRAFEDWQRERARKKRLPVGFVVQMPLRLASTCLPAARSRVLEGKWNSKDLTDLDDPSEGDDVDELDIPPDGVRKAAEALPEGTDTKYDMFVPVLAGLVKRGHRVLLFTFSRPTLAYLHRRLLPHLRVDVLHGGISDKEERHNVIRRFRDGEFDVLLASRVASEGLDFEFCSVVVNYDLPWNPMEVEQRIGRIDRYGQTAEKVLILNFHTPGTIETDIVSRLHDRIGVFRDSIGELEPILQSHLADLKRIAWDPTLSREQRIQQQDQMLTAIEEQRVSHDEIESASSLLASADQAEIDGFEDDLIRRGRYVGQRELELLIADWVGHDPDASCARSPDGAHLMVRGTPKLEDDLRGVQTAGERSALEIEDVARQLRHGQELWVCLDQETARATSRPLLTTNHPLVRAALRVPGFRQARFAHLAIESGEIEAGGYLVLFNLASWQGLRPAKEVWSSAVHLGHRSSEPTPVVGAAVLAALAAGELRAGNANVDLSAVAVALEVVEKDLMVRQVREEFERITTNGSLIDARRISVEETYKRKREQIQSRIDTLRRENKPRTIPLHEAQLRKQSTALRSQLAELDERRVGSMQSEALAVAVVSVSQPMGTVHGTH